MENLDQGWNFPKKYFKLEQNVNGIVELPLTNFVSFIWVEKVRRDLEFCCPLDPTTFPESYFSKTSHFSHVIPGFQLQLVLLSWICITSLHHYIITSLYYIIRIISGKYLRRKMCVPLGLFWPRTTSGAILKWIELDTAISLGGVRYRAPSGA